MFFSLIAKSSRDIGEVNRILVDRHLVLKAKKGDEAVFYSLILNHKEQLYKIRLFLFKK